MTGAQVFLHDGNNSLKAATITASSVKTATKNVFPSVPVRAGTSYGKPALSGAFTDTDNATFDVVITSDTATTPRASTPVFIGVGNGTMTDLAITPGTAAQEVTATLTNLGTTDTAASVPFYGLTLSAKSSGTGGNSYRLTVDDTNPTGALGALTKTDAGYSTLDALTSGDYRLIGSQWDYGALPLDADGNLPDAAPRYTYGDDEQIYRQWSAIEQGERVVYVDPAIVRDVPAGTTVYNVTGGYKLSLFDGVSTTEVTLDIVSLYDAAKALLSSGLIDVDGVVVEDSTPGGMARDEFPLTTDSFRLPITYSGSDYITATDGNLSSVSVVSSAPTELTRIECIENLVTGREKWTVTGTVSGDQSQATTGLAYTGTAVNFTIPVQLPPTASGGGARLDMIEASMVYRTGGEDIPCVYIANGTPGIYAENGTYTLTYRARPANMCDCSTARFDGRLSAECLGVDAVSVISGGTMETNERTSLLSLYGNLETFITGNTSINATTGTLDNSPLDIQLYQEAVALFAETIALVYSDGEASLLSAAESMITTEIAALNTDLSQLATLTGVASHTAWAPMTVYAVSDTCIPGTPNGHFYKVTHVGSSPYSGDTEPAWPLDGGGVAENVDTMNQVSWQDMGAIENKDITSEPNIRNAIIDFKKRYRATCDKILLTAGVRPNPSSAGTGSGCWRDYGGDYWWVFEGSGHAPAFSNKPYHSMRRDENGDYYPTKEFGFIVAVACEDYLLDGDQVKFEIVNAASVKAYLIGDYAEIPTVYGSPLYLSGGVTGNNVHTWSLRGSVDGLFADYAVTHGSETVYAAGGQSFKIYRGGVKNVIGDRWRYWIEGNQYKWRKNSGSYSTPADIPTTAVSLSDGITADFASGVQPSYLNTDAFEYTVKQPNSPGAVVSPTGTLAPNQAGVYRWIGATATLTLDVGSNFSCDTVAIRHLLPVGATCTARGLTGADAEVWSQALTYYPQVMAHVFSTTQTQQKIEISVASATDGGIVWVWAGEGLSFTNNATSLSLTRNYLMGDAAGSSQDRAYLGKGRGVRIAWEQALEKADSDNLQAMIDDVMENNNAPIIIIPNKENTEFARLAQITDTDIEMAEWNQWSQTDLTVPDNLLASASLELAPVFD